MEKMKEIEKIEKIEKREEDTALVHSPSQVEETK